MSHAIARGCEELLCCLPDFALLADLITWFTFFFKKQTELNAKHCPWWSQSNPARMHTFFSHSLWHFATARCSFFTGHERAGDGAAWKCGCTRRVTLKLSATVTKVQSFSKTCSCLATFAKTCTHLIVKQDQVSGLQSSLSCDCRSPDSYQAHCSCH